MADLEVREYATYDEFARSWDACETDTRMLWQLLGHLEGDELLVKIPEWLGEENTGYVDGAIPTEFIGRIEEETEKAVRLVDSASARSLKKVAHRIHNLEQNEDYPDRNDWLNRKLHEHRRKFEKRADAVTLSDEWFPKSQLQSVVRRP